MKHSAIHSTLEERIFVLWQADIIPASRVYFPNISKILYSYNWDVGKIIFLNIFPIYFCTQIFGSQYFFNLFYLFYFYWWNNSFTTLKFWRKSGCCVYGYIVQRGIFIHLQLVIRQVLVLVLSGFEPLHLKLPIQCYNHYTNSDISNIFRLEAIKVFNF